MVAITAVKYLASATIVVFYFLCIFLSPHFLLAFIDFFLFSGLTLMRFDSLAAQWPGSQDDSFTNNLPHTAKASALLYLLTYPSI